MKSASVETPSSTGAGDFEALARVVMAYSAITEKLQKSHDRLEQTVRALRDELREKNRLLERRNRLAAIGEMAAGMAHEIRNPLGGIQLYASLLRRDLEGNPAALQLVEKISAGVRRLEALVTQVLQFSREIVVTPVETDLHGLVAETLHMAAEQISNRRIETAIEGPRPFVVKVDPLLIGQALLNLVLNAVEAMPEGGRLTITCTPPAEDAPARQFRLIVEDSGPGIPPEILDRIFNPFFTTRASGTGLGLAIVQRIVEAHDGSITAANRPEGGARMEIRI